MNKTKFINWLISFLRTSNWQQAATDWKNEADIVSVNDQMLGTIFRRIATDYAQLYERVLFLLNEESKLLLPKKLTDGVSEQENVNNIQDSQEADEIWNLICERNGWKNG